MEKNKAQNRRDKPIKLPTGKFEEVLKAVLHTPPPKKKSIKCKPSKQV
jgi:hypothetical protein